MVEFTLFGIPVRIHPIHWVGLAIIGGILNANQLNDLLPVLFFVIAGFISILAHEMGHALVGRKMGAGASAVSLVAFGGYTEYFNASFSKKGHVFSILAGPGASILIGVIAYAIQIILLKFRPDYPTPAFLKTLLFVGMFQIIAIWWTILNLLPIYPLDGGQVLAHFVKSPKNLHLIGVVASLVILGITYIFLGNSLFLTFLLIYLAFQNFQAFKNAAF